MRDIIKKLDFESVCEFGNQSNTATKGETTKELYVSLGCKDYVAIDVNEKMDAVVADLNYPVDLGRQFDLVTNNGTSEHIFDQCSVFRNAHNLSKKTMLHVLPLSPWVNHGFFNYNPVLFRDLSIANDYKFEIYIANRWGFGLSFPDQTLFKERHPWDLVDGINKVSQNGASMGRVYNGVFIVAILEKTRESEFQLPLQGKYKKDIEDQDLTDKYAAQR